MQTESETSIAQNARPLATQPLGRLMRRYAVPCMTSLVVAALYNMVDQVFIANAPTWAASATQQRRSSFR